MSHFSEGRRLWNFTMAKRRKDIHLLLRELLDRQTTAERAAYLDEVCCDDPDLRTELESLLQAHEQAGCFLEYPFEETLAPVDAAPLGLSPGTIIGPYKLLEKIGEGGMAVVYMAEQEQPLRRRVAFKVIKLGMDTKQVIARFEAERQALALMDHPNIAKVFDAGTTETGRPYFVMELVRGVSITGYCDKHMLNTRERLDLFIQVCRAVQHAHQKGIIHRDISVGRRGSSTRYADFRCSLDHSFGTCHSGRCDSAFSDASGGCGYA